MPRLARIIESLWIGRPPLTPLQVPAQAERSVREHEDLLKALKARDPQKVHDLVEAHIVNARDALLEYYARESEVDAWVERVEAAALSSNAANTTSARAYAAWALLSLGGDELEGVPSAVRAAVGSDLGTSDWVTVAQEQVDLFADATGDHQWIHVDAERARRESPFGGPIAHGYLTLALSNLFLPQIVEVRGVSAGLNRGTGKVRFPTPVPVGSRLRASARLVEATDVPGGVDTTMVITVELEGAAKPACVIESLSRWLA